MKRRLAATACVLGLSLLLFVVIVTYVGSQRSPGEPGDPELGWPLLVGLAMMYLIPLGTIVLVVLGFVAIVRTYLRRTAPDE